MPPELEEARLIVETGFPPQITDQWPEELIEELIIYKGVTRVAEYGGNWQP